MLILSQTKFRKNKESLEHSCTRIDISRSVTIKDREVKKKTVLLRVKENLKTLT